MAEEKKEAVPEKSKEDSRRLRAVALQYRDTNELPKVITAGADEVAEKIVTMAKAHGVPVTEDQTLTDMLTKIPIGAVIPVESFRLVADIISFLYHCDKEWREGRPKLAIESLPKE